MSPLPPNYYLLASLHIAKKQKRKMKKQKVVQEQLWYKYLVLYFGTAMMMFSPFVIDSVYGKIGMLIGLTLITIQTEVTKQRNLTLLNLVGICGYLYSLLTSHY